MRKIYHFLLFCFISGVNTVYAQYTAVPDPHFEAYLEDNGMGDGVPGNGLVLTANIENVTELVITNNSIADFTGIENFIALEVFGIGWNTGPITYLDLSNNINLTVAGFSFTNITSVDLSQNNNLTYLNCTYNLQLNSLIVSSPYITEIDAWENHLTHIDVSNCPALEYLRINYNVYLSSLDISNNPNLITLRCSENNLTSLDTSNNPLLEVLAIGNNPNLVSLDLSQNPLLRIFTAGHNNSMAYIDARNGNNENFELFSANPATNLQCVYVDDAEASYLEDWSVPNHTQFANNEQECSAVSVDDYQRPVFSMYPNPAKERVTVISNSEGAYRIYSSEGKVVITGEITQGFNNIYLSNYPTGLYYLELESAEGKEIKRVVKE